MQWPRHLQGIAVAMLMAIASLGITAEPFDVDDDGWHTWRTDAVEYRSERCCFHWTGSGARRRSCDLDLSRGNYGFVDGFANYSGEVQVYVRMLSGRPEKITVLSPQCQVRTSTPIDDHGRLPAAQSVAWLERYISDESDLTSDALAAIALHGGDRPTEALIDIIESDREREVRKEAVYWLVQSGSAAAFEYVDRLLTGG